jgi:thioredoxin 2
MELVCPHCDTVNRLPAERVSERPDCGRCGRPLVAGAPVALDAARFDRFTARNGLPVVVDFWAAWCGPCRMMAPQFEAAAGQLAGRAVFAKVDTESAPELSARLGIRSIPTVVLFDGGREVARVSGAMSAADLVRWVERAGRAAA